MLVLLKYQTYSSYCRVVQQMKKYECFTMQFKNLCFDVYVFILNIKPLYGTGPALA